MSEPRVVCRFSCGAASAIATKMAIKKYGLDRVEITYSGTNSEHPDNQRFMLDCERWFGKPVTVLTSEKYRDVWDVWERERFITSKQGAPCTGAMKREPAYAFELPSDIMVFGYTADKPDMVRAENLRRQNFERVIETPLIDAGVTKVDCLAIIKRAGIPLPAMYLLGFRNNNCIGCPKGGMGYWNKIRKHFPAQFERMAALQRHLGPGSYFFREKDQTRFGLDDLAPDRGNMHEEPDIECSVVCHSAEELMDNPPLWQIDNGL